MLPDVLARSVEQTFNKMNSELLSKVANRWKLELDLIIKGRGGNNLVVRVHALKAKLLEYDLQIPDSDNDEQCERMLKIQKGRRYAIQLTTFQWYIKHLFRVFISMINLWLQPLSIVTFTTHHQPNSSYNTHSLYPKDICS